MGLPVIPRQILDPHTNRRYEALRSKLISLQTKICNRTGRDPLLGTGFDLNPVYNAHLATAGSKSNIAIANAKTMVEFAEAESSEEKSPKPKPRKSKSTFQACVLDFKSNSSKLHTCTAVPSEIGTKLRD